MPRVTRITLELPGDFLAGRSRDEVCAATDASIWIYAPTSVQSACPVVLDHLGRIEVIDITVEDREIAESRESVAESAAKRAEMPQDRSEGMDSSSPSS